VSKVGSIEIMDRKKYNLIFLALVLFIGCAKKNPTADLGDTIIVTAEIPEESQDLDFIWELTSLPDNSILTNVDIASEDTPATVRFTPDVSGNYSLEVSIFQYNDEISTESFSYNVIGNEMAQSSTEETIEDFESSEGDEAEAVTELLAENDEPKWYDSESVEEVLADAKDVPVKAVVEETEEVEVEEKTPPSTLPAVSPPPKKVVKKLKVKPNRGASIPYDKNRFTIQVGSKKVLADAKTFAAKLIDAGYDAYIQKAVFKETNEVWYRIRVGSYDKRETATAVAKSLSKTQQESAWVDFVRYEY
tara:strand:+ start:203 stop:1117 length:915 start_codon:yes stop_codon:yes gene_type:complete